MITQELMENKGNTICAAVMKATLFSLQLLPLTIQRQPVMSVIWVWNSSSLIRPTSRYRRLFNIEFNYIHQN